MGPVRTSTSSTPPGACLPCCHRGTVNYSKTSSKSCRTRYGFTPHRDVQAADYHLHPFLCITFIILGYYIHRSGNCVPPEHLTATHHWTSPAETMCHCNGRQNDFVEMVSNDRARVIFSAELYLLARTWAITF